jgi:hypothetical protein
MNHLHLPSVHIRTEQGTGFGFDYEEDLYVHGRGRIRQVDRVVRFVVIENGMETLIRETRDRLCEEEWIDLQADLPLLIDEGNPEANAVMEERAHKEFARQSRIAAGVEHACACCGCSESRSCSTGCLWATDTLCSRCVRGSAVAAGAAS